MLQDLAPLKSQAEESVSENLSVELYFDVDTQQQLLSVYRSTFPKFPAVLQDNLIKITNKDSQAAYLPLNWFSRIRHCRGLIEALQEYAKHAKKLEAIVEESTMRGLPTPNWRTTLPSDQVEIIDDYIAHNIIDIDEQNRMDDFLCGEVWLDPVLDKDGKPTGKLSGKKLQRQPKDYISSCITSICKLINDTAGKLEHFITIYIEDESVRSLIDSLNVDMSTKVSLDSSVVTKGSYVTTGYNKIFYGAPGTGKSHSLKQGLDEKQLIRTVFHPDTQYSDFVGCLKPVMDGDKVTYQFRAGPFTEAVIKAVNDPSNSYHLVIEEINRAAAAAVFGEIFQLLDREKDGGSTYSIDISDPDLSAYLNSHTDNAFSDNKIKLPPNLSLLATMNSSDQAVMPMDTAFKRRWEFEYLKIDYTNASYGEMSINLNSDEGVKPFKILWADFARVINTVLISEHIAEDRLLGHRFISENEFKEGSDNVLKGKLLMYLWDDVLRHGQHTVLFRESTELNGNAMAVTNFGQLIQAYEEGAAIFNESVEVALSDCLIVPTESELDINVD
ncbi:dynein-related subfamily AAA family protein [Vibrio crassostreae]|uniref:McrB family protein n=1 Tax=Vibrio crassostreae TaxID=246167 RepID=UPI000F484E92|nr:AAA family ATPase [Vibrio crassostreae]ROR85739.1 dynein-related subfamily AAA family protein [Vibrio crassostreae]